MNVKPGDVARIVGDDLGNHGAQVYVDRLDTETPGTKVRWWVEALEPIKTYEGIGIFTTRIARPGAELTVQDQVLRRIDPPADDTDTIETRDRELVRVR